MGIRLLEKLKGKRKSYFILKVIKKERKKERKKKRKKEKRKKELKKMDEMNERRKKI